MKAKDVFGFLTCMDIVSFNTLLWVFKGNPRICLIILSIGLFSVIPLWLYVWKLEIEEIEEGER